MKVEMKHIVGAVVALVLTAVFRDELTLQLKKRGWL
jgi:hypothetical protein